MSRGRRTRALNASQIARLDKIRRDNRFGVFELKRGMSAPFSTETLQKALDGKAIWEISYAWLVQWIERHAPEKPLHDGKAAAAGKDDESEPPADAAEQAADDFGALGEPSKR